MMLSNSSKYAINAVLYLAVYGSEEKKLRSPEIAEGIKVPSAFLAKILQTLSRKNLVSSTKGPNGGFFISPEAQQVKLVEIIRGIDGVERLEDCVLGLKECSSENPCPVHFSVQPYKKKFLKELEDNSIASFAEKVKKGEVYLFV